MSAGVLQRDVALRVSTAACLVLIPAYAARWSPARKGPVASERSLRCLTTAATSRSSVTATPRDVGDIKWTEAVEATAVETVDRLLNEPAGISDKRALAADPPPRHRFKPVRCGITQAKLHLVCAIRRADWGEVDALTSNYAAAARSFIKTRSTLAMDCRIHGMLFNAFAQRRRPDLAKQHYTAIVAHASKNGTRSLLSQITASNLLRAASSAGLPRGEDWTVRRDWLQGWSMTRDTDPAVWHMLEFVSGLRHNLAGLISDIEAALGGESMDAVTVSLLFGILSSRERMPSSTPYSAFRRVLALWRQAVDRGIPVQQNIIAETAYVTALSRTRIRGALEIAGAFVYNKRQRHAPGSRSRAPVWMYDQLAVGWERIAVKESRYVALARHRIEHLVEWADSDRQNQGWGVGGHGPLKAFPLGPIALLALVRVCCLDGDVHGARLVLRRSAPGSSTFELPDTGHVSWRSAIQRATDMISQYAQASNI